MTSLSYYTGLAKNTPPALRLVLILCETEFSGRPVLCPIARAALGGLWRVQGAQAEMENSKKPRSVTLDSWTLPPEAGLPLAQRKSAKYEKVTLLRNFTSLILGLRI